MIFGTVENIVLDDKDSEKLYKIYVATTTGLTGNTIEAYPKSKIGIFEVPLGKVTNLYFISWVSSGNASKRGIFSIDCH